MKDKVLTEFEKEEVKRLEKVAKKIETRMNKSYGAERKEIYKKWIQVNEAIMRIKYLTYANL